MLLTSGYTVGTNQPLTNARILWSMLTGTVVADGTGGVLATNDFTGQRWTAPEGLADWTLTLDAPAPLDTVMIACHNLNGASCILRTSPDLVTAYTDHYSWTQQDNATIALMLNNGGVPHQVQRIQLELADGSGYKVGIIRAGVALQMTQPLYGGHKPINLNRVTEAQHIMSETGQWLGRIGKLQTIRTSYEWDLLFADWYDSVFEPFAQTLPLKPFGIIANPQAMPKNLAWCWTNSDVSPENMGGGRPFMKVELNVVGFAG